MRRRLLRWLALGEAYALVRAAHVLHRIANLVEAPPAPRRRPSSSHPRWN